MLMPGRTLHLSRVEVFLHIDAQNVAHLFYILRTFAPVQHEDRDVEQDGECQQNKRVHRLPH